MPATEVRVDSRAPATLGVTGALVFDSAAEAYGKARDALGKARHDTLDLSGVTAADSAGLACVLAVMATARRQGGKLQVVNMPASLNALARVCGVDSLLA